VVFHLAAGALPGASFTATLDRDSVVLGETVTLTLTFQGGAPDDTPALPPLANVQIGIPSNGRQFSFGTGQQSVSTVTFSYPLTPTQPGELAIPAIQARVGGQGLSSQPLKLRVLKPDAPPANADALAQPLAFLRLFVPKKEVYLGEAFTVELQLYVRNGVQDLLNFQLTPVPADGLTVGKTVQGQQRQAQVGNVLYTVVPLPLPVTAGRTGELTLGPVTASVVLALPAANPRRRGWPFDDLGFPSFFGRSVEHRQVPLATEAAAVRVLPLPTVNVPADFHGAVGDFSLSLTAGPTNVAVGDPITIKAQISGRGAVEALSLPDLAAWREFRAYPPSAKVELSDKLGLEGTKSFEQVVVPLNTEIKELPRLAFSFFDPEAKTYRTLTQPAVPLVVRPAGSVAMPTLPGSTSGAAEDKPPAQDIVPIKQHFGAPARMGPPLVQQPWFLAVQSVPVFAWAGLLVWRRRAKALANNPRLRRRRQGAQLVRGGLAQLRQSAAANDSDAFFTTLFRLLQEQTGERLDLPASAITEAAVEERLRPLGAPEATLAALHELFQTCNQARYAPVRDRQELSAIIPRLEAALQDLQRLGS
jgi:hypothetical protein